MTAPRRLRSVRPAPEQPRFTLRPAAMYPGSPSAQASYVAAVAFMRDGRAQSIFTLDPGARPPAWRAIPKESQ